MAYLRSRRTRAAEDAVEHRARMAASSERLAVGDFAGWILLGGRRDACKDGVDYAFDRLVLVEKLVGLAVDGGLDGRDAPLRRDDGDVSVAREGAQHGGHRPSIIVLGNF